MSNESIYEKIQDSLPEHIENYFRDSGDDKTDKELLEFIWMNDKAWETLKDFIASSKLGDKIVEKVYQAMPEGGEFNVDRDLDR